MYHRKSLDGTYFIYFWVGRDKAVGSGRPSRLFGKPFYVSGGDQTGWRETSRPDMIAPELLTYWEI